jgi:hypothetical protein
MASIAQIAKARAVAIGIERGIGIAPDLDIRDDHVRLYYSEGKKEEASRLWGIFLNSADTGDVRIDFSPELVPGLIKKYWLYSLMASALVYAVSKKS